MIGSNVGYQFISFKNVTGFGKTLNVHIKIEIHFIAYYNSHIQALSRHSDTIAIDKQIYFYR